MDNLLVTGGGAEFPVHVVCGPLALDLPGGFLRLLNLGPLHIPMESPEKELENVDCSKIPW